MKGIILGGGNGSRLYPITSANNKLLTPIYDKPMIYYPLATLMQAGINEVMIITNSRDNDRFKMLLGDGSQLGMKITYGIQDVPRGIVDAFLIGADFIGDDGCALILGDNLFHGPSMPKLLSEATANAEKGLVTLFGIPVPDPERFGIVELDAENNALSIVEKPKEPKSNICVTGLYFYPKGVVEMAKKVTPSARGEYEITDLNNLYLELKNVKVNVMGEETLWLDAGTFASLLESSAIVKEHQDKGDYIAFIEEEAYKHGWISKEQLTKLGKPMEKNTYGQHLLSLD